MKKLIFMIIICICLVGICGCGNNQALQTERDNLQSEISDLENEISDLQEELDELDTLVDEKKVETDTAKYVITFSIRQKHYNLSISDAVKDAINEITIQILVDKEYYDSVEIGDTIDDSFRIGSLIMDGSFGSWDVTVEDKEIQ